MFAKEIAKEKTAGILSGITASNAFQKMSSSVTGAYGAAKTKMSNSYSQQTFDEALDEHKNGAGSPTKEN